MQLHDLDELRRLREAFRRIASPPGLFHVTRVRLDGQPCTRSRLRSEWDHFLGSAVPFEFHSVEALGVPDYQQGCFFGAVDKLVDYTSLAAAALMQIPVGFSPMVDYRRNARNDRNQWTLGLYRSALRLECEIAVDSVGAAGYAKFSVDPKDAASLMLPTTDLAGHARFAASIRRALRRNERRLPRFIYLSLATDLCTASTHAISAHIKNVEAGKLKPHPSVLRADRIRYTRRALKRKSGSPAGAAGGDTAPAWPPDEGWHFRPGEYAFLRQQAEARGKSWQLLKTLAEARRALTQRDLMSGIWKLQKVSDSNLRGLLSKTRNLLRHDFGLSKDVDPIPAVDAGESVAWKIDEELLRKAPCLPQTVARK